DTGDLTSTSMTSFRRDEDLAVAPNPILLPDADRGHLGPVPLQFGDNEPNSQRHGPPPSHKRAIAAYAGRMWAAADAVETSGAGAVALGPQVGEGIATDWTAAMAGRLLYVDGSTQPQVIQEVRVPQQMLVLEVPYKGATQALASYAIRPAPIERRLVYF